MEQKEELCEEVLDGDEYWNVECGEHGLLNELGGGDDNALFLVGENGDGEMLVTGEEGGEGAALIKVPGEGGALSSIGASSLSIVKAELLLGIFVLMISLCVFSEICEFFDAWFDSHSFFNCSRLTWTPLSANLRCCLSSCFCILFSRRCFSRLSSSCWGMGSPEQD